MNTFGTRLRLTTFGESHGQAIGGILDGFPAGVHIDFDAVNREMEARRPGQSAITSARCEKDMPEFLSGINDDGITLGTPISFIIKNSDTRSADYNNLQHTYRPSHADFCYDQKYGIRDWRGGGRASARETAVRVCAGALCMQMPQLKDISVFSILYSVGDLKDEEALTALLAGSRTPQFVNSPGFIEKAEQLISRVKADGDSIGGTVACAVFGLPVGIGEPLYDKLSARLAYAILSINAAKGFDYGLGFDTAMCLGSQINDPFVPDIDSDSGIVTSTNYSGGIQGGISNGMPVFFRVPFKPTPTIMKPQTTVDDSHNIVTLTAAGRHDPCVAIRAIPVVKAMTLLTLADLILQA